MELITSINQINTNMQTLDEYLDGKHEPEYSYALRLIKRGICFNAVKSGGIYKFYPSKFIGYIENTMDEHQSKVAKRNGRDTNQAISDVLLSKPLYVHELECAYREYCERLGFTANEKGIYGVQRKYWRLY